MVVRSILLWASMSSGNESTTIRVCTPLSDQEPGTDGPRRLTQQEIRDAFDIGWKVCQIEPTRFETVEHPGLNFSPGGPKAWLATMQRT